MKNTMVNGNNDMQAIAMRIMNDVKASGAKLNTMDDLYSVVSNYVKLTKEQFVEYYNEMKAQLKENTMELSEDELDMVAGGGVCDWISEHKKELLLAAGIVLLCTSTFAGFGVMMAVCAAAGEITAGSMVVAGTVAGICGAAVGGVAAYDTVENKL